MDFKRVAVLALAAVVLSSSRGSAGERTKLEAAVLAPVYAFISAAQTGDIGLQRKQYMPTSTIIDDHPPYMWTGKNAIDAYFVSFPTFVKKVKMTDLKASIGEPKHIHIAAMTAYVVLPVKATSKVDGKPFTETGLLTFTLQKTNVGWKITTQSYAEDTQTGSNNPY